MNTTFKALSALLTPVINLGLMSATREATAGRFPMPTQLLTGFRGGPDKTRGMLSLGGLYGLGVLLILLLAGLMAEGSETAATMTAEETNPPTNAATNAPFVGDEGYFAYGRNRRGSGVPTDFKFTGQKQDGSGLQYFCNFAQYFIRFRCEVCATRLIQHFIR